MRSWGSVLLVWSLLSGVLATEQPNNSSNRPKIKIAHLFFSGELHVPLTFMLEKLNAEANRTILPDFDIVLDPYEFELHSGEAATRFVEILQAPEPYHAVVGPWARSACTDTVDLTAQARVLHVALCENAEFTEHRDRYPYIFRAYPSVVGVVHFWMYVVSENHWFSVLSIMTESTTLEATDRFGDKYGVRNMRLLAERGGEDWQVEALLTSAVSQLRLSRTRVVFTYFSDENELYRLTCHIHRSRIKGLQYFLQTAIDPGWMVGTYDTRFGDCSPQEILDQAGGYFGTLHIFRAPGSTVIGNLAPVVEGQEDTSSLPMTCLPSMSAQELYGSGELLRAGFQSGYVSPTDVTGLRFFLGVAGPTMDTLCSALLGLHDVLYNRGIELESVESRNATAFHELLDSVAHVDYISPTGRFRYYPETGEREVVWYQISQVGLDGNPENVGGLPWVAAAIYPNGLNAPPEIVLFNGSNDYPITWKDGGTWLGPRPHLAEFPNCSAQNAEFVWDHCEPCTPGRSYDALLDSCRTCASGEYQNSSGATDCIVAGTGWFINDTQRPTHATLCPPGMECPQVGTILPLQCRRGLFAPEAGLAECLLCPAGKYQAEMGATACSSCAAVLGGSTTATIASTSPSECICPDGTFRPFAAEGQSIGCLPCLEGMVCPQGSDLRNFAASSDGGSNSSGQGAAGGAYPLAEPGYMTLPEDPLKVYSCKTLGHCPGGPPATCGELRDRSSVACGRCREDAYESGDDCKACDDSTAFPMIAASVISVMLVGAATWMINSDMKTTPQTLLVIVAISSLLFTSIQALGIFHQLSIPWKDPVKSMIQVASLLAFDLEFLKLSCTMGTDPVRAFAFRQAVPVFVLPIVAAVAIGKYVRLSAATNSEKRAPRVRDLVAEVVNAIGALYSLFFISIVISMLNPFLCYQHPDENGESVISAPSLLCFASDEHAIMIVISVISASLVPIPFLALCAFGILRYRKYVNGGIHSGCFLHAFRFLFIRYSPQRYYFQMILLMRSLMVCIIPAVMRGSAATQVIFMCLVLIGYSLCVTQLRAWRAPACNIFDAILNAMTAIVLFCGALFVEDKPNLDTLAALTAIAFLCPLILGLLGLVLTLRRHMVPSPFYEFFICHHKAHAAAQARFLKIMLQSKSRGMEVFIDSDNLKELHTLFDIVKSRVRHLVVYLTADTLRRPWCVGEITSAMWAELRITRLQTPSFTALAEEQVRGLVNPEAYIDSSGCNLSEYGIQWEHVVEAFAHLLDKTHRLELSQSALGTQRFGQAAAVLLHHGKPEPVKEEKAKSLPTHAKVIIATDRTSDEANAAAGVLAASISEATITLFKDHFHILADYEHTAASAEHVAKQALAVVVLMSAGCLQREEFLRIICALHVRETGGATSPPAAQPTAAPSIVAVNTPDFVFPSERDFTRIRSSMPALLEDYGEETPLKVLRAFFKSIAVFLPTHASQDAINIQSQEVLARLRDGARIRGSTGNMRASGLSTDSPTPLIDASASRVSSKSVSSKSPTSSEGAGKASSLRCSSAAPAHNNGDETISTKAPTSAAPDSRPPQPLSPGRVDFV